jgi:uncharacterized protein
MVGETMIAAAATLVAGMVIGILGQRSRLCFIGGIRDFILVRDTGLLGGVVAFGITAWLAFPLAAIASGAAMRPAVSGDAAAMLLTLAGGCGVGFVSTLANGCPFRQHVLAAQGAISSIAYLAGFAAGAVVFHAWVAPAIARLLP